MSRPVKVAFASCAPDRVDAFVLKFSQIAPEAELFVVSEFPPPAGRWIPYRIGRSWDDNVARIESALQGRPIAYSAIVLEPKSTYARLRWMSWRFAPFRTLFYNHNLDHYMLRPRGLPALARHVWWRLREHLVFQTHPGGDLYTWLWRLRHPSQMRRPLAFAAARIAGRLAARRKQIRVAPVQNEPILPAGMSVVIPSRNGQPLLERLLPHIGGVSEVIVVDNGSDDGTEAWLRAKYPQVRVEVSREPLSFARAVNRGIRAAQFSHTLLLNNDMVPEPGFFAALGNAFSAIPGLFCATAQIFFPEGRRREETGKAVMRPPARHRTTTEFPVHCIEPIPGEDLTWVIYGSGGCSLYDTRKLRLLGGLGEVFAPAYVEDLDICVRAWQRGWSSVFVAGARTLHDHRTTTSRYYSEDELARVLERNYLRFLARSVSSPALFRRMWSDALVRLNLKAALEHDRAAEDVLVEAWHVGRWLEPSYDTPQHEELIFALGAGDVAVFPGRAARTGRVVAVASCYSPFPLSHGGAVRMYNLMRRAAADFTQVLLLFVDELRTPPPELLDICAEIVQVRRVGTHAHVDRGRPDAVDDFDSPAFRAALQETVRKWNPEIVQLEFTQMAQYAADCGRARTVLVEHDVTVDLYRQLLSRDERDYDLRQQLERWVRFEKAAWRDVDCVVTMSEKDRRSIEGARLVETLANGVDLERFQPSEEAPEPGRILFIGSFNHLPNLLALDFFLREIWVRLAEARPTLHVIAGSRHQFYFERWRDRLSFRLDQPGLEIEDFVSDVRPAYRRASVVMAPLLASAGTNIKIMEAMAMGKAIVSTPGGVNGLDELRPGHDVLVESDPGAFAAAITAVLTDQNRRDTLGRNARATAERVYNWDAIAEKQRELYRKLLAIKS
ncbi:MAG: glycosyltransferase [Bryobacteraceae bacterium]|nr:glycosyltransferase [Bryobacteraceae bacterium]